MKIVLYISGIISTIICVMTKSDTYAILGAVFLTGSMIINQLEKTK